MPADLSPRSEADQAAFFADVLARTERAMASGETIRRDLMVAGQHIRLHYAGAALDRLLTPAFACVVASDDGREPDLTVFLWDSTTSGIDMAPPPVPQHCFSDRGDLWTFGSERWRSAFHFSEYSLALLDMARGVGVFWVRDSAALPYWAKAAPLRTILSWWLTPRGAQLVHGAAVGTDDGGVLIVGRGGVGKSTTALACVGAGMRYCGDDYVVLTGGSQPAAHALYRTAKLFPEVASHFPKLGGELTPGAEKMVLRVGDESPEELASTVSLRVVVTLRFGAGAATSVEPALPASVLGSAIYTTMTQLPHAGKRTVDLIEDVLSRLPCVTLVLGSAVSEVPIAVAALIADPPSAAARFPSTHPQPFISVIVPVFNGLHYLPEAVASILAQDYPKLEIIVVDDGVIADIGAVVAALPIPVRLLRKRNGGAADARNTGIRAATGELIAFLDVDDLWPAGALAMSLAWLNDHPDSDVAIGQSQLLCRSEPDGPFLFAGSPAETFRYSIGAALFRRRAFDRNGVFDSQLRLAEDTDWFARAAARGIVVDHIAEVTLYVRRDADNTTFGRTTAERIPLKLARNALRRKRGLPE
jgi:hypothetical protein